MRSNTNQPQARVHTCTGDDELDISREWDLAAYGATREGMRAWLEKERPHLLRAYDAEFLVNAVEASRGRAQAGR
jgi:hypothetical protein